MVVTLLDKAIRSQTLAVILTDQIFDKFPLVDNELRQNTSLVIAMSGKTKRGIVATMRIFTPRMRRLLTASEQSQEALEAVYTNARPSGPYTLQCMMPNVAAGRAALLLNLNGPNFVVDAGTSSLEPALDSAMLLLRGGDKNGTKMAVIDARIVLRPYFLLF